jgi:hypothetical protein
MTDKRRIELNEEDARPGTLTNALCANGHRFVVRENGGTGGLFLGCSAWPDCTETAEIVRVSKAQTSMFALLAALLVVIPCTVRADVGQPPIGDLAPYTKLMQYAEQQGIVVTSRPSKVISKTLTLIGQASRKNGTVWVASDITAEARVCVLAHELTHAVLQRNSRASTNDLEAAAFFVGYRVCDSAGYAPQASGQLAAAQRFPGVVRQDAVDFASKLSSVTEG